METLFIYIVKVNIALTVFYLLYMLLFRKDTFIRLRRYYFLSAIIFSLAYPLFTVSALGNMVDWKKEEPVATETSVYIGEISSGEWIVEEVEEVATPINWAVIAKNILLVGILFLSFRLLCQLFSILRIKSRSQKRSLFGYLFYHLKEDIAPFSFFNWIFVNSKSHNEKELKQILLHEYTHANQWHSLDILLVELLRVAFWWNPIVWLMKRDITINLEYLADEAVLQEGVESTEYQYHLLQLTNHETAVQIVNNFNVSQLKQRIIMMNTNKTPMRKLAKYLSVLPLALLLIVANSVHIQANEVQETSQEIAPPPPPPPPPERKESKSDEIFVIVEEQPSFKEGVKAMMDFIESEMKYPVIAKENGIEGRVIVNFIIEKDGTITNPQIVRGADPSLDKEAIRIIKAMPKWNPGLQRNERVRVRYTLPISFKLDGNTNSSEITTAGVKILKDENEVDNEVIVRGYGSKEEKSIQSLAEKFGNGSPLIIVDDVKMEKGFELNSIMPSNIESITVLKEKSALEQYGEEGKNGVIIVTLKDKTKIATSEKKKEGEDIFVVVEDQPQFPGGTEALMQYLGDNVNYPKEAHEKKIQGRVIVNFVINKDGSISDVNIVRGVDPLLDAEAIRVISAMPNWKPGKQRGETVRVRYTLPISFKLKADEEVESEAMQKLKEKGPVTVIDMKNDDPEKAFHEFIGKNARYPVIAQENGIMGFVKATYDVNSNGEVSNIKIVEGVDPALDKELTRIIEIMPNDIALMKSGGKAASNVEISAVFRLQNGDTPPPPPVKSDVVVVGYGKPAKQ